MGDLSHIGTLLLVEDEYLIAAQIRDELLDLGVGAIEIATSSAAALAYLETKDVAAALVDVTLPDGRCDQIVSELTKRSIPFVYLTGYVDVEALDLPPAVLLAKPVDDAQIVEAFRRIVA